MSYHQITKNGVEAAEPLDFTEKKIALSCVVQYRGRSITIEATGYTLDQFCDLLDKRAPIEETHSAPSESASPPMCPTHRKPMREGKGGSWYCPSKVGDGWCKERA